MLERQIQARIMTVLTDAGWIVVRPTVTNLSGFPDLMALRKSFVVFIEVKRPGQKPTELQMYRHGQLRSNGFEVIVASSTTDVKDLLI